MSAVIQLAVPPRHRDAMGALARLSADAVAELGDFMDTVTSDRRLVRDRMTAATGHDLAFDALIALNATRLSHGISAADAAQQAIASMDEADLNDGFASLLENALLVRFAKVLDLEAAVERRLHSARVLTDIRPVFQEDPTADVDAVLINQTLQLVLLAEGAFDELFISVDGDDLRLLSNQIDRAVSKAATARRLVEGAGVTVVDSTEDDG